MSPVRHSALGLGASAPMIVRPAPANGCSRDRIVRHKEFPQDTANHGQVRQARPRAQISAQTISHPKQRTPSLGLARNERVALHAPNT